LEFFLKGTAGRVPLGPPLPFLPPGTPDSLRFFLGRPHPLIVRLTFLSPAKDFLADLFPGACSRLDAFHRPLLLIFYVMLMFLDTSGSPPYPGGKLVVRLRSDCIFSEVMLFPDSLCFMSGFSRINRWPIPCQAFFEKLGLGPISSF